MNLYPQLRQHTNMKPVLANAALYRHLPPSLHLPSLFHLMPRFLAVSNPRALCGIPHHCPQRAGGGRKAGGCVLAVQRTRNETAFQTRTPLSKKSWRWRCLAVFAARQRWQRHAWIPLPCRWQQQRRSRCCKEWKEKRGRGVSLHIL